ncbi:hypothetical protein Glove_355g59 [Diversispora epigaea]|uniref:Uncharacterized protein n=1 Tax=Diversispora epigaea TaxID=1348612 RepID=A0A397HB74_9GLOM|nr:hypothetical protein Glove_355g59 [Diversispora epigaea]
MDLMLTLFLKFVIKDLPSYCLKVIDIGGRIIGGNDPLMLKHLLRNVLDPQSASSTITQLQQKQNYSDEIHPNWAYNEQKDIVYDTKFVQMEGEDELSFASTSSSRISAKQ